MASPPCPEFPGSFRFEFDAVNRILLLRLKGRMTEETLREIYTVGGRYWTATMPNAAIVDCSSVTETTISSDHIRGLARRKPMPGTEGRPRIVVAPTTLQYGLARMFQLGSEHERPLIVVHTMDEALAELGIQSPHFEPLE
jgi:hypothetical protein